MTCHLQIGCAYKTPFTNPIYLVKAAIKQEHYNKLKSLICRSKKEYCFRLTCTSE